MPARFSYLCRCLAFAWLWFVWLCFLCGDAGDVAGGIRSGITGWVGAAPPATYHTAFYPHRTGCHAFTYCIPFQFPSSSRAFPTATFWLRLLPERRQNLPAYAYMVQFRLCCYSARSFHLSSLSDSGSTDPRSILPFLCTHATLLPRRVAHFSHRQSMRAFH